MVECFQAISTDSDCRVVVISANGKHFTAGLDLSDTGVLMETVLSDDDVARKFRTLQPFIKSYQLSFTSIEQVYSVSMSSFHPCQAYRFYLVQQTCYSRSSRWMYWWGC